MPSNSSNRASDASTEASDKTTTVPSETVESGAGQTETNRCFVNITTHHNYDPEDNFQYTIYSRRGGCSDESILSRWRSAKTEAAKQMQKLCGDCFSTWDEFDPDCVWAGVAFREEAESIAEALHSEDVPVQHLLGFKRLLPQGPVTGEGEELIENILPQPK